MTDEAPPATINIQWNVVTFASGVRVQRGETAQDFTGTPLRKDVTLPLTLAAVNQAFRDLVQIATAGDTTWDGNDPVLAEITSTTNLQFGPTLSRLTPSPGSHRVPQRSRHQRQKGSTSMGAGTASVTDTLSPAVDVNKTFVLAASEPRPLARQTSVR